ncbi:MAG: OsmC family protein [Nitrospiraceae bacterium]|nr:OsmC family protein [Nitrospiraceae bacterium]
MPFVKIKHAGGMRFSGETSTGHDVVMDAGPEFGGENRGARPMDVLLASLGGCTGMDVISILRKKKQDVTGFEININGRRAEEHPKKYTDIDMEFVVRGRNISPEAVERAVQLSMEKYCSVKATIEGVSRISYRHTIINE